MAGKLGARIAAAMMVKAAAANTVAWAERVGAPPTSAGAVDIHTPSVRSPGGE
jgi:hypothetical protein